MQTCVYSYWTVSCCVWMLDWSMIGPQLLSLQLIYRASSIILVDLDSAPKEIKTWKHLQSGWIWYVQRFDASFSFQVKVILIFVYYLNCFFTFVHFMDETVDNFLNCSKKYFSKSYLTYCKSTLASTFCAFSSLNCKIA